MAKRKTKATDEQQPVSPDIVPDPADDATGGNHQPDHDADRSTDGNPGPDIPDGEIEPETDSNGKNADAQTPPPPKNPDPAGNQLGVSVKSPRLCSCGTEMDIVKKTIKRRFDMKNKVTYHDALQCHCPNCHRVKEFELLWMR